MKKLFLDQIGDSVLLAEKACQLTRELQGNLPDAEVLLELTANYGIDVATSILQQAILQHKLHGPFCAQVDRTPASSYPLDVDHRLFVVPGLYYADCPEVGAHGDLFRQVAARFGIDAQRVPTVSRGSIVQNVAILHKFLTKSSSQPFWLASVSRGSAEIKWLLNRYPDAEYLKNLKGWVSINGVVRGSALLCGAEKGTVRRRFLQMVALANSVNPALVDELNPDRSEWHYSICVENIVYLNVISIPMRWDITHHVQKRFRQLSEFGPNDGVVVLGDYVKEPGFLYPVSGVDHLLRTDRLSTLFYRLIRLLLAPAGAHE